MLQMLAVLDRVIVESRNCGKEEGRGMIEVLLLLYVNRNPRVLFVHDQRSIDGARRQTVDERHEGMEFKAANYHKWIYTDHIDGDIIDKLNTRL